jgi:hypothetical protein
MSQIGSAPSSLGLRHLDFDIRQFPLSPCRSSALSFLHRAVVAACVSLAPVVVALPAVAVDYVTLHRDGKTFAIDGRLLVEAQDGGLLLLGRDAVLWTIPPQEQIKRTHDTQHFQPYSSEEMGKRLLAELPQGFQVHTTKHYLICYDTSSAYAQWCGSLFERLYMAFINFWSRKGFELHQPEFPLVAVVFTDKNAYLKFSEKTLGKMNDAVIGYFHMLNNRMTMYDLTGIEAQGHGNGHMRTTAQINQILAQPDAMRTVSTIVHEATHQIAFNCGLHTRLSDCPNWFSEGIAMYFETPDLRNAKGWGGIGAVNRTRLEQFQRYLAGRPENSIETLVRDDKRFRDPKSGLDAYAEAWALTHFLIRQHPKNYLAYLAMLSKKQPLVYDMPEKRVEEFQRAFGNFKSLDVEFLRYMGKVR